MNKTHVRSRFRALRESLPTEKVVCASNAICQRLSAWTPLLKAETVLTYIAFRNEIDLNGLLDLLPHVRWAAPRVKGEHLILHQYDPDRLIRHRFGMLEPAADLPVVVPGTVDVVLVPGTAFDRHGGRLGFGAGFYDRLLSTTPALRVGVTYDRCLADAIPMTERDQWMDWVVTPTQMIRCQPR